VNAALVARIRAYTEYGRAEAMRRTLEEIRSLPETEED